MKTVALIVAGGKSRRFGGEMPKQFREVSGKPLLTWTISRFEKAERIDQIVVVVAEEYLLYTTEKIVDRYNFRKVTKVVVGGASRRESVLNGLESLPISTDYVAIHDAARLLILPDDINRVIEVAANERAAILAVRASDTVKRVKDGFIITTLERDQLYLAQTPQVFQYDLIIKGHRELDKKNGNTVTDDAALIERCGFKVKIVEPTAPNFKITTKEDILLAEVLLKAEDNE